MKISKNARGIVAAATLAAAFMGGIALAPMLVAPAAAQLLGGSAADNTTDLRGPGGAELFSVAAQYIGITVEQLRTEMGTDKSLADVAVAHGKTRDGLVQALTAAEQANIAKRIGDLVDHKGAPRGPGGPGGHGRGLGPGFGFRTAGDPLQAASTYLGISTADLMTQLRSGKSLADIASATSGKSRDGLIQAIVSDDTAKIDQAVKDGKLTADRATKLKADLTQRVTEMVDSTHPMGGPGMGHGFGPGGPRGPRPSASPAQSQ
jgi:hypothetical protein